jgi:large subunit ribosomal protein L5
MDKLITTYKNKIKADVNKDLGNKNIYMAPDIEKISINMGFGNYKDNKDYVAEAEEDLAKIAGQKPLPRYAKQAISSFKLRENELIGYAVTLRGEKAWDFLEKVIKVVLPGVRDFRGLSRKSFDGKGNYCFGIKEHFVFPEINPDKVKHLKSLQINIVTTTDSDEESEKMLESIGFPLVKSKPSSNSKK